MKCRMPRPGRRARLLVSLTLASAVGLLTVAAAGAQPLEAVDTVVPGVPTTLSAIPGASTAPGHPPATGVPLDEAVAAFRVLSAQTDGATAVTKTTANPISAVFMAPVGVLAVIGTPQSDTLTVSRDAAGKTAGQRRGGANPGVHVDGRQHIAD
jgi:hypothetical protein